MKRNIYFSTPLAVSAVSTGKFEQWNQRYKETCFFKSLKEMCGIDIPDKKRSQTGTALSQWTAIQRNNLQQKEKRTRRRDTLSCCSIE